MNVFLVAGIFEALFLMVLILSKKNKSLSDYFLSASFLLFGITILLAAIEIYNRQNNYPYPGFINTSTAPILLHGPFLWFYIKSLTTQKFRFRPVYILHFVPFVITFLIIFITMMMLPAQEKINMDYNALFKNDPAYPFVLGIIAISNQAYFVWGLVILRRHNLNIKKYFSHIDNIDLKWLKILLLSSLIGYSAISLIYIADFAFDLLPYNFMQLTGFAIASVFILIQGFFGQKQGNIFKDKEIKLNIDKEIPERANSSPLRNEDEKFISRLINYMENEKPFLNPDLTIAALAAEVETSPDYLSTILNTGLHQNFFDFINYYRVSEFKKACKDPANKNYTIISIAYDCGFNSKATFNRVFKQTTGLTPGEYQKS